MPSPGSPTMSAIWPSPCRARSHRRKHGDFLVAADERREMALPRTASAAARPDEAEQRYWLRDALEFGSVQNLSHIWSGDGFGLRDLRLIERPHVHVALG